MKPLLLIGAALMVGAGIYGFVDYKKAHLKKEFNALYIKESVKDVQVTTSAPMDMEPVPTDVPVYTVKNVETVKRDIAAEEKKLEAISKKYEQKRPKIRIEAKEFSRARLEREEIRLPEPDVKAKPE